MGERRDYYVYVHLRTDSKMPFYIGKGRLLRAWDFTKRNPHWKRIAEKHGCIVELLSEGLTQEQALDRERKEIAWARQYYPLANATDGGDGNAQEWRIRENQEKILEFFTRFGRFPAQGIPEERAIAKLLNNYTTVGSRSYDQDFHGRVLELSGGNCIRSIRAELVTKGKEELMAFYDKNLRLPLPSLAGEHNMYARMRRYISPDKSTFDPDFRKWCEERGYGKRNSKRSEK